MQAGLFSAVVTAFLIESYSWLQADPGDQSVKLLTQISSQLSSLSMSAVNASLPEQDDSLLAYHPSHLQVRVNVLWFLSLFISLIAALFAILVQQWLHYLAFI